MDGNQLCFICNKLCEVVCYQDYESDKGDPDILSKNVRTYFLLRHVIGLPLDKLESYLKSCPSKEPGNWIKLCGGCNQFVEKSQQIYKEMVLISKDFENLRNAIIQTIVSATATINDEQNYPMDNLDISGECRRFIQNQQPEEKSVSDHALSGQTQAAEIEKELGLIETELTDDLDLTLTQLQQEVIKIEELNYVDNTTKEADQNTNYQENNYDENPKPSLSLQLPPSPSLPVLKLNYSHPVQSSLSAPFQCDVSNCSKAGVSMTIQMFPSHYRHHKRVIHKCTECDKILWTPSKIHWSKQHPNSDKTPQFQIVPPLLPEVPWWCPICYLKFDCDSHRYFHVLEEHPNQGSIFHLTCMECPSLPARNFVNFHELELHAEILHRSVYICKKAGCGQQFMEQTSLRIHTEASHPVVPRDQVVPFSCKICGNTYRSKIWLNRHIKRVHEYQSENDGFGVSFKLRCKICGKLVLKHLGKKHMFIVHKVGNGKGVFD